MQTRKNGATNVGLISWQGIRAKKLIAELTAKDLYKNGKITRSKASLDEMVKYMLSEIYNNPANSKTKKEFLDNPNVAYDKGHKILGDNYIIGGRITQNTRANMIDGMSFLNRPLIWKRCMTQIEYQKELAKAIS